jgi:PAS domain S-box-containing protein
MTENASLRPEAFRKAVLVMLLLSPVWILVTWYQARNAQQEQQNQIRQILHLHVDSLKHTVLRLTDELNQLHEFLRLHDTDAPDLFAESFKDVASGLHADSSWVQAYQIIENGVITNCYPIQGNEAVLGIDLYEHASPEVSEDLRLVTLTGNKRLTGPRQLIQGEKGIILRGAGTTPDHPGRSVAIVVRLEPFLYEAGIKNTQNSLLIALRSDAAATFLGNPDLFQENPEIVEVQFLNQVWQLAAVPAKGWNHARLRSIVFFGGNGSAILGLAGILTYLIAFRQQELTLSLRQRTQELFAAQGQLKDDLQLLSTAEAKLRISDARLRAIFEQAAIGVTLIDSRTLRFIDANKCAVRILGYSVQELETLTLSQIIHLEDVESCSENLCLLQARDIQEFAIEHRCLRKDGGLIWVNQMTSAIPSDQKSAPMLIALFEDIQDRKSAEQRLQDLADSLPGQLLYVDRSQVIQFINRTVERWHAQGLGPAPDDMLGHSLKDVLTQERYEVLVPWIKRALDGETVEFTMPALILDNGEQRFCSVIYAPHFGEGGSVPGFFALAMDITDRRKTELERDQLQRHMMEAQKMEAVGTLAGGIAHDFNNMLQVILGYSEILLLQTRSQPAISEQISAIQSAARRSSELTQQLLAFARRQSTARKAIDLNETVPRMLKLMRRVVNEKIELTWNHSRQLWPILIDPGQLDQIVANLVVNARDAIEGSGRITLTASNLPALDSSKPSIGRCSSGDCVVFSVSDNGRGIDETAKTRIFEPFFTTKDLGKGTGLGLSTVYGIVKAHDGVISVTSTENSGTTFDICLPRCEILPEQTSHEKGPDPEPVGSETILLVDDQPQMLDLGTSLLQRLGYSVIIAHTAAEAISVADQTNVHLLITDVFVTDMNGRDLADAIVKRQNHTRVLFISGFAFDTVLPKRGSDPEIAFLQKPFSPGDLASRVREILTG